MGNIICSKMQYHMVGFFKSRYHDTCQSMSHLGMTLGVLLDNLRSSIPAIIESPVTTHVPFYQLCFIPSLFSSLVFFCCVSSFCQRRIETVATSKMELFVAIVNKKLHLRCCSSPRSASVCVVVFSYV